MSVKIGEGAISLDLLVGSKLKAQAHTISNNVSSSIKSSINKSLGKFSPFSKMESETVKAGQKIGKQYADSLQKANQSALKNISGSKISKSVMTTDDLISRKQISLDNLENEKKNYELKYKQYIDKIIELENEYTKRISRLNEQISTGGFSDTAVLKANDQISILKSRLDDLANQKPINQELINLKKELIKSDDVTQRLNLDIRSLDQAIEEMNNPSTNQSLDALKQKMDDVNNSTKKMATSVKKSQRPLINMRSIGASLARNLLGLQLLITFAGQAMRKLASAMWNALTSNKQFNDSLATIKGNLVSAFAPIGEAIMPFINQLMSGISKLTAQLALFVNLMFGKTVKAAKASASALNKEADAANNVSAGFDQFNDITAKSSDSSSGVASPINLDEGEISKVQAFSDKIKKIFEDNKQAIMNIFIFIGFGLVGLLVARIAYLWQSSQEFRDKVISLFNHVKDTLKSIVDFIIGIFIDLGTILTDTWDKYGQAILDNVDAFIIGLVDTFDKIWTEIIDPIIQPALEMLSDLWNNHLKGMLTQIADFVAYAVLKILEFYNKFIKPIVDWLVKILGPIFSSVFNVIFSVIGNTFGGIFDTISKVIGNLRQIFDGFFTFLEGLFTGDIKKILGGFLEIVKGVFGGLFNIIKSPFNMMIDAINGLINGLAKIKVPNWVPGLGGLTLGFPGFTGIPRLANGGVLTQPTLALAGEYSGARSNPEIVSPQSLMAETFREVLNELLSMNGNNSSSERVINLVVNIGGQQLLNTLIDLSKAYAKQTGKELILNV